LTGFTGFIGLVFISYSFPMNRNNRMAMMGSFIAGVVFRRQADWVGLISSGN
jgi:hypothetical protein